MQVAERIILNENNFKFKKYFIFIVFLLPFFGLAFRSNFKINFSGVDNAKKFLNNDPSILGHLPYKEISKEKLVFIEPNIEVHIDMSDSLLKMREDARKDGIYLIFLSGYRSINLQKEAAYYRYLIPFLLLQNQINHYRINKENRIDHHQHLIQEINQELYPQQFLGLL